MYHNKRKAPSLQRIKVECLYCHHHLNRDKFENHRKIKHQNDMKCSYAIVNDSKQMKLSFASATATGPGAWPRGVSSLGRGLSSSVGFLILVQERQWRWHHQINASEHLIQGFCSSNMADMSACIWSRCCCCPRGLLVSGCLRLSRSVSM